MTDLLLALLVACDSDKDDSTVTAQDADDDGFTTDDDCDDAQGSIHPGADEVAADGVVKVVETVDVGQMSLVLYRNAIAGSNTGGIRETQDMIDFCAVNDIRPEIEKIPTTGIDAAWTRVIEKKARYRYVVDIRS